MDLKNFENLGDTGNIVTFLQCLDPDNPNDSNPFKDDRDKGMSTLLRAMCFKHTQTVSTLIEFINLINPDSQKEHAMFIGGQATKLQQTAFLKKLAEEQTLLGRYVQQVCTAKIEKAKGTYFDASTMNLICQPPNLTGNDVQNCSDSGLKLIPQYTGDENDTDGSTLEVFLKAIFDLARTSRLSENCAKQVLIRKLSSTASIIIDDFVKSHDKELGQIPFAQIIQKLESKFAVHCQPAKASASLQILKQGTSTFAQLEAKIRRLAFLASRQEPPDTRKQFIAVKEIEAFKAAISTKNRELIFTENSQRVSRDDMEMDLNQMAQFLLNTYAEKTAYEITTAASVAGSESTIHKVENVNPGNNYYKPPYPQQNWRPPPPPIHQGQRGFHPRGFQQKGFHRKPFPPKPVEPKGFARGRGFQPTRGRGQMNNSAGRGQTRQFVTTTDLGLQPNACLLCGSSDHKFTEQSCPYYGQMPYKSPCYNCRMGGHQRKTCLKDIQGKPQTAWNLEDIHFLDEDAKN